MLRCNQVNLIAEFILIGQKHYSEKEATKVRKGHEKGEWTARDIVAGGTTPQYPTQSTTLRQHPKKK
jgi:hypothetical protein